MSLIALTDRLYAGRSMARTLLLLVALIAAVIVGLLAMLAGVHPVAAYSLVGLGAAAYAPAKYGLVTELLPARALVAANGLPNTARKCWGNSPRMSVSTRVSARPSATR